MHTVKNILAFLFLVPFLSLGQANDPAVTAPGIDPAPLPFPGNGQYVFSLINNGFEDIVPVPGDDLMLEIVLSKSEPSDPDIDIALTGSAEGFFDWDYDDATRTITGVLINTLPSGSVNELRIDIATTEASTNSDVGFEATIIPSATVTSNGNITLNDVTSIFTRTEPADDCNLPLLSIGEVTCNPATQEYEVAFYTNADDIQATAGVIDLANNVITNIPISQSVTITASNGDGCEVSLVVDPPDSCSTTCTLPNLSVGQAVCDGIGAGTYTVDFNETTGATIEIINGNDNGDETASGTIGQDMIIRASNDECILEITVSSPDNCDDPCEIAPISISGPECSTDGSGTYQVYFTAIPGAVVSAIPGVVNTANGTITNIPSGIDVTITVAVSGCDSDTLVIPAIDCTTSNDALALVKTGVFNDENSNDCSDVGETILYTFLVRNDSAINLENISLSDPLLGGSISGPDSGDLDNDNELDPGEVWTYTASYGITQTDIDIGEVQNQATVQGITPSSEVVMDLSDNNSFLEDDPTVTSLCQRWSLSLEKSGVFDDDNNDDISQVGENISYSFAITNTGNVTLYDLTLIDNLPGITINGTPIPSLEPNETDANTFTASYSITQQDINAGQVINQAQIRGEEIGGIEVFDDSDDPNNTEDIDNNSDGEPDDPTIVDLPSVEGIQFEIYNGVTPDGNGINDYLIIVGIENYPDNEVKIFNKWGVLVFETQGYGGTTGDQNVFTGFSDARATVDEEEALPVGTYFYVINFPTNNPGQSNYTGYFYLNR